jgi:hypothetical protein
MVVSSSKLGLPDDVSQVEQSASTCGLTGDNSAAQRLLCATQMRDGAGTPISSHFARWRMKD